MMQQRVSLITVGVKDLAKAAAFYEALGWARVESQDGVVAFDLIGQTLGLYPLDALAEDLGLSVETLGAGRMTLGYNVVEKADVAPILAKAKAAGGDILKPAQDVFWGGHHGYFADPEGHIWEIAHNPFSPLGPNGEFQWNGAA
jgi:catechol 2,3-dioxygenase-like lactoylglutathione lyase family enzyme|tara:strand:- start:89 stop:520 length:432 start_codon:yes stop_codon:yes gene_type:complete